MSKKTKPECRDCTYCGMDMDLDPFCTHPVVLPEYPQGKALHTGIKACPAPDHPLFESKGDKGHIVRLAKGPSLAEEARRTDALVGAYMCVTLLRSGICPNCRSVHDQPRDVVRSQGYYCGVCQLLIPFKEAEEIVEQYLDRQPAYTDRLMDWRKLNG